MPSIIANWISDLPYKQQALLFMSLRNCDIVDFDDPSRILIHEIRKVIFKSSIPVQDIDEISKENEDRDFRKLVIKVCINSNKYPMNFYKSLAITSAILGYHHPEFKIKKRWFDVYVKLAQKLNLHIESIEDLNLRTQN